MRITALMLLVTSLLLTPAQERAVLVFHTDDFSLNLHHFLYVLGRNEARMPDRGRRAVIDAPGDAEMRLAVLTPDQQRAWREAVTSYAQGPSKLDAVFDDPLVTIGIALARVGTAASLSGSGIDPSIAGVLEKAAPIYRKAWWPAHQRANVAWVTRIQPLVDQHGRGIVQFLTRAYQLPWPAAGYPVRVSAYANWAGAYSTRGNLLVMSSLDEGNDGNRGLEISFHEAAHQWDDEVDGALSTEAKKLGVTVPGLLSHALIFYTAAEATRSVIPGYTGYAEANGMWRQKGLGAFKQALDEVWKPYLDGKGTRAEAFAAILSRTKN